MFEGMLEEMSRIIGPVGGGILGVGRRGVTEADGPG